MADASVIVESTGAEGSCDLAVAVGSRMRREEGEEEEEEEEREDEYGGERHQ